MKLIDKAGVVSYKLDGRSVIGGICDGSYRVDYDDIHHPEFPGKTLSALVDHLSKLPDSEAVEFPTFTPSVFPLLQDKICRKRLPVLSCLLSREVARDLLELSDWTDWYSPTGYSDMVKGRFGKLADLQVLVDILPEPVLKKGEVYFLSSPQILWPDGGELNPLGVSKGLRR